VLPSKRITDSPLTPTPKEPQMNRVFKSTPTALRAAFATASLLVSLLVVGSMAILADHYHAEAQWANSQRAVVAQR
jgi:hypothetical protein